MHGEEQKGREAGDHVVTCRPVKGSAPIEGLSRMGHSPLPPPLVILPPSTLPSCSQTHSCSASTAFVTALHHDTNWYQNCPKMNWFDILTPSILTHPHATPQQGGGREAMEEGGEPSPSSVAAKNVVIFTKHLESGSRLGCNIDLGLSNTQVDGAISWEVPRWTRPARRLLGRFAQT
ncbi:hypothetical protein E2C01_087908 [Portunus trituberculatus]|uniref:Uncharacterized protein n=1 Tax=Portunus trituberculatus TaxID=210409 RepID=A0A5B7J7V2_PORTR|nr:hypothetical protein [Portunus trituberculatus]